MSFFLDQVCVFVHRDPPQQLSQAQSTVKETIMKSPSSLLSPQVPRHTPAPLTYTFPHPWRKPWSLSNAWSPCSSQFILLKSSVALRWFTSNSHMNCHSMKHIVSWHHVYLGMCVILFIIRNRLILWELSWPKKCTILKSHKILWLTKNLNTGCQLSNKPDRQIILAQCPITIRNRPSVYLSTIVRSCLFKFLKDWTTCHVSRKNEHLPQVQGRKEAEMSAEAKLRS